MIAITGSGGIDQMLPLSVKSKANIVNKSLFVCIAMKASHRPPGMHSVHVIPLFPLMGLSVFNIYTMQPGSRQTCSSQ